MITSLANALLLIACALFAGFEVFGIAFGIGDGGGSIGLGAGTFLTATLVGAVGCLIAALGSWARSRTVSLIGLTSALLVLPAAFVFCRQDGWAFWHYSQMGFHYGLFAWATVLLPVPFDFAALLLSGLRFRQFRRLSPQTQTDGVVASRLP